MVFVPGQSLNWVLTHMPGVRSRRGMPGCLGMHSPENRSRGALPSSLGIHSSAVRNRDTRKQKVRRPGSRNMCPVGVEVY